MTTTVRAAPVLYLERQGLGQGVAACRQFARLTRADLAHALGVPDQRIADLESGSLPMTRGR